MQAQAQKSGSLGVVNQLKHEELNDRESFLSPLSLFFLLHAPLLACAPCACTCIEACYILTRGGFWGPCFTPGGMVLTGPHRARHAPGGSGGSAWKKKGMEWRN